MLLLCGKWRELIEEDQLKLENKEEVSGESGVTNRIFHEGKARNYILRRGFKPGGPSEHSCGLRVDGGASGMVGEERK